MSNDGDSEVLVTAEHTLTEASAYYLSRPPEHCRQTTQLGDDVHRKPVFLVIPFPFLSRLSIASNSLEQRSLNLNGLLATNLAVTFKTK
jgi:hypothetical protein